MKFASSFHLHFLTFLLKLRSKGWSFVGVEGHETIEGPLEKVIFSWVSLVPIGLQGGHKTVFISIGCKELWGHISPESLAWPSQVKAHATIRKVETNQVVAKWIGK